MVSPKIILSRFVCHSVEA